MRIIRAGKPPGRTKHRATCSDCKCHFEFTEDEAKWHTDQREGGGWWTVKCPQKGCPYSVTVYPK